MATSTMTSTLSPNVGSIALNGRTPSKSRLAALEFDPTKHLHIEQPSKKLTFADLGWSNTKGISPVAVTEPFRLFTDEAVREMRREILSPAVLDDYTCKSHIAACQIREYPAKVAPFVHAAWKHPETMKAVSSAAGIDLEIVMDLEIGHINYQVGKEGVAGIRNLRPEPSSPMSSEPFSFDEDSNNPKDQVVGWHNDSYPFVAVLMLSDCTTMRGGETAIECGDGRIAKARGPTFGSVVIMQGHYLKHQARKAFNAPERLTMVTSYRAKDPMVEDDSNTTTVRPITKAPRLNYQWCTYRLKLLSERFATLAAEYEEKKKEVGDNDDITIVDVPRFREFSTEQIKYILATVGEMMN